MRSAEKKKGSNGLAYVERVNRAIDYVMSHMQEPLRLDQVSRAACLSPFHFHRVFQAVMGVTLAEFVKRLRLERALVMMAHSPKKSLTTIALACGFASSSDFSRSFKQQLGVPPSAFDMHRWRRDHQEELQTIVDASTNPLHVDRLPERKCDHEFKVNVRSLPARTVAYLRVNQPYRGDRIARGMSRMMAWAEDHGAADGQWLGYQWDNPEIVSLEDCIYHIAVESNDVRPKGDIGRFEFPPMKVAEVEVRGGLDLELHALQWLYGVWLPLSGYVPDDQPCFESWIGRPFAHGTSYFELNAMLPVRAE